MTRVFSIGLCFAWLAAGACSLPSPGNHGGSRKAWKRTPAWAQQRLQQSWWKQYGDAALNNDIAAAFANNPDLAVVAARLERAGAVVKSARAASLPSLNLGIGRRDGRKKDAVSLPYDLAPWEASGQLSWEPDLSGRLRAATRSARHAREAAFWDLHAARLQLASRIAATRFNLYRLNTEVALLRESAEASRKTTATLRERAAAGIVADTQVLRQQAEHEKFQRQLAEAGRLRGLALVQLRTLTGGGRIANPTGKHLPAAAGTPGLPLSQLLRANPAVLAAEARVRSAFDLQQTARLDLLPSFRLTASAAGSGDSLTGKYTAWLHSVGPSLDIPVYDPVRLAKVSVRRAESAAAAALYRSAVLKALEDVDTAQTNLRSRRAQLAAARRESAALQTARHNAKAQFDAGLTSQIEFLDTERRWLEARRSEAALRQLLLSDHIQLMKALGG